MMDTIEIKDRLRTIKYPNTSVFKIENIFDKSITNVLSDQDRIMGVYYTTIFLWAGLLHQEPHLTINKASEYLDNYLDNGGTIPKLFEIMFKVLQENKVIASMVSEGQKEFDDEGELGN